MHWRVKNKPVNNIIIFEKSAQMLTKALPVTNDLIKSRPPKKIINPKRTTICINIFFLEVNLIDKYEKIRIGIPKIDGIYEVKELLPLIKLIIPPHNIKNSP